MPNPRNATTTQGKRFYTWRERNYWSVTTILQVAPKPALINWAKKFTAEYAVDHFDAFKALVEDDPMAAVDWLKGAAWRDRDRKAELGSFVHAAAEAYVLGQPFPKWPKNVEPPMRQFIAFLDDCQPVFEQTELSVYSKTWNYAGTLDGIATLDGRVLVGDWKTGADLYPEVALQLAAYRHAEFIGAPDGDELPMPKTDGAFALHLPRDGSDYVLLDVRADDEVFQTFLYMVEVFKWQEQQSKSVLLGPLRMGGTEAERELREALT
jgi:hypothetical protein